MVLKVCLVKFPNEKERKNDYMNMSISNLRKFCWLSSRQQFPLEIYLCTYLEWKWVNSHIVRMENCCGATILVSLEALWYLQVCSSNIKPQKEDWIAYQHCGSWWLSSKKRKIDIPLLPCQTCYFQRTDQRIQWDGKFEFETSCC
jgi:hypothetical protein